MRYSRFVIFLASDRANLVSVEGFLRNFFSNLRTLFLKMKSSWKNLGRQGRSVINVVFVGACILIIFRRVEFRSTGQREVEEEISVFILFTNIGSSIDLKSLYVIRVRLIFVNLRFIENSIIK